MTSRELDSYLALVADRQRRRLLQQLRHDFGGEATIDELAESLLRTESSDEVGGNGKRGRQAMKLHHVHLPKLAAHDVVEYDPDSSMVRYNPDETFEALLDSLPGEAPKVKP